MSRQLAFGDPATLAPEDLRTLVGVPLSPAQLEAATAPLEPGVIVAGAGSGKTTVMAARVVWLVATEAVAPHEVLGLTFTTKAAAQLAAKVRTSLRRPGVLPDDGDDPGEPLVSTYHAFAARLLVEHGVRLGVEPTSRLLTDASRYQLAHRVVCRPRQPFLALDEAPTGLVKKVAVADYLSANLVDRVFAQPELYTGTEVVHTCGICGASFTLDSWMSTATSVAGER